jgi:hypothetical protein
MSIEQLCHGGETRWLHVLVNELEGTGQSLVWMRGHAILRVLGNTHNA